MHSPEVVAFNIRRPWPKRDKTFDRLPNPLTASWCVVPLSEPEREQ